MSNGLDPDQDCQYFPDPDRHFVCPDLGPADNLKLLLSRKELTLMAFSKSVVSLKKPNKDSLVMTSHSFTEKSNHNFVGAQWLSGRVLDSRLRGRGFEPYRHHCVVSLSKNIDPSLVLAQPRKTCPYITERLLMRCKESNQASSQGLVYINDYPTKYKLSILLYIVLSQTQLQCRSS